MRDGHEHNKTNDTTQEKMVWSYKILKTFEVAKNGPESINLLRFSGLANCEGNQKVLATLGYDLCTYEII